mmetsp:Transcript_11129/g.28185  ORF Transcript_11129/g.28185 Transcript_11129/m.28185 type:complete len:374 (-) Transcript_11129:82-1203(-)
MCRLRRHRHVRAAAGVRPVAAVASWRGRRDGGASSRLPAHSRAREPRGDGAVRLPGGKPRHAGLAHAASHLRVRGRREPPRRLDAHARTWHGCSGCRLGDARGANHWPCDLLRHAPPQECQGPAPRVARIPALLRAEAVHGGRHDAHQPHALHDGRLHDDELRRNVDGPADYRSSPGGAAGVLVPHLLPRATERRGAELDCSRHRRSEYRKQQRCGVCRKSRQAACSPSSQARRGVRHPSQRGDGSDPDAASLPIHDGCGCDIARRECGAHRKHHGTRGCSRDGVRRHLDRIQRLQASASHESRGDDGGCRDPVRNEHDRLWPVPRVDVDVCLLRREICAALATCCEPPTRQRAREGYGHGCLNNNLTFFHCI